MTVVSYRSTSRTGRSSSSSSSSGSGGGNEYTTAQQHSIVPPEKTFHYFAYGSNMLSSTMTDLRKLKPLSSTAAILPGFKLRFNVPGLPRIEPSWASVEPIKQQQQQPHPMVHGVLYNLTAKDFATICQTEGVPLSYMLHKCRVIPYIGDGKAAGQYEWDNRKKAVLSSTSSSSSSWGLTAYTLLAGPIVSFHQRNEDILPSQSYMNVLIRGAKEYALDESYVRQLEEIQVGTTWFGNGFAEEMLRRAARRRTSSIDK